MSLYALSKILYLTDNDAAFRQRLKDAPEEAIAGYNLKPEEREALLNGAVGRLYGMGVHTFLLNHLPRYELFGVTTDNYLSRIREGLPYDPRFEHGAMPRQLFIQDKPAG